MELEFRVTQGFNDDLQGLPETVRRRVAASINRKGQLAIANRKEFYRGLRRPGIRKLAGGLDSSLYVMPVGKDVRVIFALDDDPIFGKTAVTLLRVVRHQDMESAYRSTALALYGEGLLDEQKEARNETAEGGGKQRVRRQEDETSPR